MLVRTSWTFRSAPSSIWPLLCNSRMDRTQPWSCSWGVPQPVECRLAAGPGGVGATRECVSDQGLVRQEILVWEPERRLSFKMKETDLYFRAFVSEIVETFDLEASPGGARVTRTTRIETSGGCGVLKRAALYIGLKRVHRFVFRNWERAAAGAAAR